MTQRAHFVLLLVLVAAFGPVACASHYDGRRFNNGTVSYKAEGPGAGWSQIEVEDTDIAWFHAELGAGLLVNSHCEGVEDAPLEALTRHLVMGMTDREVQSETRNMKSGREALETLMTAKLDGVPQTLVVLVMKKDGCVYDVVLNARPETVERARPGYNAVTQSLDVERRADAE